MYPSCRDPSISTVLPANSRTRSNRYPFRPADLLSSPSPVVIEAKSRKKSVHAATVLKDLHNIPPNGKILKFKLVKAAARVLESIKESAAVRILKFERKYSREWIGTLLASNVVQKEMQVMKVCASCDRVREGRQTLCRVRL